MATTRARPPRLPQQAQRLRLAVWQRTQARMRERYGFDLAAPDVVERARSLVAARPGDADRVLLLAAALSVTGDSDLALLQAQRALELSPDHARAHTTLAALLTWSDRREEALSHARRAAELDGGDPSVLYNLGLAEWFGGDRNAARDALTRAESALVEPGAESHRRRRWWPMGRHA